MTLFEILIVMMLVATIGSVLSMQLAKALKTERFEQNIDMLLSKLTLAQEIMLDFHTNVTVTLLQNDQGILCNIDTDAPLPHAIDKSLNRYSELRGIDYIAFDGEIKNTIVLLLDATLGAMPKGSLSCGSKNQNTTIQLNGYPAYITRGVHQKECHATYPKEIISII